MGIVRDENIGRHGFVILDSINRIIVNKISFDDIQRFEITKRILLSIAAQAFDPCGTILNYPIFIFKYIFRDLTFHNPNLDWLGKALDIFFVAREYKQPRFNVSYHPSATHHLICMSDARESYYAHVIILVTQLGNKEENTFSSKCTFLL